MSWRALDRKQSDDAAAQKYKETLAAAQGATLNAERKLKLALEEAERARAEERRLKLSVRERRSADCSGLSFPATRLQLPEPATFQPTFGCGNSSACSLNMLDKAKTPGYILMHPVFHAGLIKELSTHDQSCLLDRSSKTAKIQLDIKVVRSPEGVLEIEVVKTYNIILGNRGQRELQVGDKVLAVDGVPLGSNSTDTYGQLAISPCLDLAQTLELVLPGKREYVFTVERGGGFGASHVLPVSGLVAGLEDGLKGGMKDGMIAETEDAMLANAPLPLPLPLPLAVHKMSAANTDCLEVELVMDQPLDSITERQDVYRMGLALDVSRALADESVKAQVTSVRSANINSLLPGNIYSYSSLLLSLLFLAAALSLSFSLCLSSSPPFPPTHCLTCSLALGSAKRKWSARGSGCVWGGDCCDGETFEEQVQRIH